MEGSCLQILVFMCIMDKFKLITKWVFIPFLLFLWASPAWGVLYKWKDENGRMYFTDDITKVPIKHRPHHTNKKPRPTKKTGKSITSMDKNFKEMGDALGQGMEQGMEQLAEGMAKAFQGMGEGLGKFMKIAEANKPDKEKTSFSDKEEEITYKVQQLLLGMFLMCQLKIGCKLQKISWETCV